MWSVSFFFFFFCCSDCGTKPLHVLDWIMWWHTVFIRLVPRGFNQSFVLFVTSLFRVVIALTTVIGDTLLSDWSLVWEAPVQFHPKPISEPIFFLYPGFLLYLNLIYSSVLLSGVVYMRKVCNPALCSLDMFCTFVITSSSNREKRPHPRLPLLLINPSCLQLHSTSLPALWPALSLCCLPEKPALAVAIFQQVSEEGLSFSIPLCFWEYQSYSHAVFFYLKLNSWGRF